MTHVILPVLSNLLRKKMPNELSGSFLNRLCSVVQSSSERYESSRPPIYLFSHTCHRIAKMNPGSVQLLFQVRLVWLWQARGYTRNLLRVPLHTISLVTQTLTILEINFTLEMYVMPLCLVLNFNDLWFSASLPSWMAGFEGSLPVRRQHHPCRHKYRCRR